MRLQVVEECACKILGTVQCREAPLTLWPLSQTLTWELQLLFSPFLAPLPASSRVSVFSPLPLFPPLGPSSFLTKTFLSLEALQFPGPLFLGVLVPPGYVPPSPAALCGRNAGRGRWSTPRFHYYYEEMLRALLGCTSSNVGSAWYNT